MKELKALQMRHDLYPPRNVESGEGIESYTAQYNYGDHSLLWNPVKELKDLLLNMLLNVKLPGGIR